MNKKYIITILILFLLRGLDLLLTYWYTPNLKSEYNPLVSIFGASWFGLVGTQFLFLLVIAFFGSFYFSRPAIIVSIPKLNFSDFIYCYFFGKLKPWPQRFFSIPNNMNAHLIFNGYMFIAVAGLVSSFAIVNNFLLIVDLVWYRQLLMVYYQQIFPLVFLGVILSAFFYFFVGEYKRYLSQASLRAESI